MHVDKSGGINPNQDNNVDSQQQIIQKQQASVFGNGFTDKNNNGIVDEHDFDDDITILNELKNANLLGKLWSDVEDKINEVLNNFVKVPIEQVQIQEKIDRERNEFINYDYETIIQDLKKIKPENKLSIINKLIKLSRNRKANSKLMELYQKTYNTELIDDISTLNLLSKKEKETLLKSLMGVCYDLRHYNPFKQISDNQVKNDYYTGKKYDIKYSGMVINITEKESNKKIRIDLETLLDGNSQKAQKQFLCHLQHKEIPAEVMIDLANEITHITVLGNNGGYDADGVHYSGAYSGGTNVDTQVRALIHELGHAIDSYKLDAPIVDEEGFTIYSKSRTMDEDFINTMREEMDIYVASGHKKFDFNDITFLQKFMQLSPNNYCTESEDEMFAECYDLMMTGNNKSKNVIIKYFPKTFELAKKILEEQRNLSTEQRQ